MKSINRASAFSAYASQLTNYLRLKGKHDIVLDPYINYGLVANSNWAPTFLKLSEWQAANLTPKRKVVVFVIDTAGEISHRDVSDRVINSKGRDFTGEGLTDGNGHGTACASCYVGKQNGVGNRNNTWVIPYKALRNNGSGSYTWVARAIESAVTTYKAEYKDYVGIISMSLGGSGSSAAIKKALQNASAAGMLVGASSGNSGYSKTENKVGYPAKDPNAWAIGAITASGSIANFSSAGQELVFTGPGKSVQVAWKGNGYINANGTSFGMPYAMAAISQIVAVHPNRFKMDAILPFLAQHATDLDSPGKDVGTGYGAPVLASYIGKLPEGGTPTPPPEEEEPPAPPVIPDPEPPTPPMKAKPRKLQFTFEGQWKIDWRNQEDPRPTSLYVTKIVASITTAHYADKAHDQLVSAIYKFFRNRGLILSVSRDNMTDAQLNEARPKKITAKLKRPALFLLQSERSDFNDAAYWTKRFLEVVSRVDYKVNFKVDYLEAEDKEERKVIIT